MGPIKESLTFDDVMLMPRYSDVLPSEVSTTTKLEKNLKLKIPLMSSAMDTVTESKMAIEIGKLGGIGIIHRNLSIKKQIREIKRNEKNLKKPIPNEINFTEIEGLSAEVQERLSASRPKTIGYASRLEGVTPAAISLITVSIAKKQK